MRVGFGSAIGVTPVRHLRAGDGDLQKAFHAPKGGSIRLWHQAIDPVSFVYYRWLVLLVAAGLCLLPLWATFIGGFKSPGDLRTNAFGLPRQWLVDNYVSIATGSPLLADAGQLGRHRLR